MIANVSIHLQKFISGLKKTSYITNFVCEGAVSHQHTCTAQTCTPSTSSPHASLRGSHAPCEQPPFPLRWCKASPWTWWLPAASPPGSRRGWSAAWLGARATSQSRPRQHWEEQELDDEEQLGKRVTTVTPTVVMPHFDLSWLLICSPKPSEGGGRVSLWQNRLSSHSGPCIHPSGQN